MIKQRPISLNPKAEELEVAHIIYPATDSRWRRWWVEPMRFIPHDGKARG